MVTGPFGAVSTRSRGDRPAGDLAKHRLAWSEVGLFKKYGINIILPAIAVGGPDAAAGLVRGD